MCVCVLSQVQLGQQAGRMQGLAEMKREVFEIKSVVNIHEGAPEQKQHADFNSAQKHPARVRPPRL